MKFVESKQSYKSTTARFKSSIGFNFSVARSRSIVSWSTTFRLSYCSLYKVLDNKVISNTKPQGLFSVFCFVHVIFYFRVVIVSNGLLILIQRRNHHIPVVQLAVLVEALLELRKTLIIAIGCTQATVTKFLFQTRPRCSSNLSS